MTDPTNPLPVPPENGGSAAEELAYRLRQQQLTAEFGLFALKTHDVAAMLQEATHICAEGLQSELCKVMEYVPAENNFIVRAGVGWSPGVVGNARMNADIASPTGYAFQTGWPVISNQLSSESRFRTPQLLAEHGVKRAINVVIRGNERYGVLEVDSTGPGRFTESDLAFLQGFANLLGVAIDRQRAEEALTRNGVLLRQALETQEVLTQEVGHRVKNSLTIVVALLTMQRRVAKQPEVQRALKDAETRVHTIAHVHDRLWRKKEAHQVDLAEYMRELCDGFAASGPGHSLSCAVAPMIVSTDRAIALGLLANELVTNAFKYAYPGTLGEVRLSITQRTPGLLRFEVKDNGVGLPAEFCTNGPKSLGMKLIGTLARQLEGETEWIDAKPGTRFVLDFPA